MAEDRAYNMWLDGVVKIDGTDALTINSADGPVKIDQNVSQISHAGSAAVDSQTDETKREYQVTISGVVLNMRQLQYLDGLTKSVGVSEDGATPADLYSLNGQASNVRRPYVELLIQAQFPGTQNPNNSNLPYKCEIWGLRAKLMGNLSWSLDKDNYTKVELTLKMHRDPDDRTANWFQVRDERQQS